MKRSYSMKRSCYRDKRRQGDNVLPRNKLSNRLDNPFSSKPFTHPWWVPEKAMISCIVSKFLLFTLELGAARITAGLDLGVGLSRCSRSLPGNAESVAGWWTVTCVFCVSEAPEPTATTQLRKAQYRRCAFTGSCYIGSADLMLGYLCVGEII